MSIARKLERIVVYDASTDPVEARYIWTGAPDRDGPMLQTTTKSGQFSQFFIDFSLVYYQPWRAKIWTGEIRGKDAVYLNSIPTEELPPNLYRIPGPGPEPES